MRIGARALYDYVARSDKELTFNRGDALQVITKTPDNNWWDGFHSGRRGFIPVAYVEITELKTSPSPPAVVAIPADLTSTPSPSTLSVPAPPQRKSSIPIPTETEHASKISETPNQPSILEDTGKEEVQEQVQDMATDAISTGEDVGTAVDSISAPATIDIREDHAPVELKSPTEVTSPTTSTATANFPVKSVQSLTKQFQDPEPQQKVLVEPHSHRRMGSDVKVPPDSKESYMPPPRSASSGNKVSMLSSTFESKAAAPAPPTIRPKPPPPAHPAPTSPAGQAAVAVGSVFPIMSHNVPSASPLQKAVHQSQQSVGQKPLILRKKPTPAVSKPSKGKSGSIKKKDSLKEDKKDRGPKPPPNPKPGFGASPAELKAELEARVRRKQSEDMK